MTTIILFTFGIVMIWKHATKDWHEMKMKYNL
ncbi:hypothetical protein T03_8813 [Trichinella britovi]|uniref:Uncharacterized protein n=1 Tax=Trichinella britovi TaxID=45882 RepID=A0A0V1AJZ8_TRIBR|nr:hypothetical protein T03_8813 [Trichinella britovi]